jgi:phosphatidylserine/phosphatidylglycerophosphate/cardiolipin synthase-like enzyme
LRGFHKEYQPGERIASEYTFAGRNFAQIRQSLRQRLLTGSYNWTVSAMRHNEENLIVTDDAALLRQFAKVFSSLWQQLV